MFLIDMQEYKMECIKTFDPSFVFINGRWLVYLPHKGKLNHFKVYYSTYRKLCNVKQCKEGQE